LTQDPIDAPTHPKPDEESIQEMMKRLTGINIWICPKCGKGRLARLYKLLPEYVDYILPPRKKTAWNTT
jgi:hypothetical protein